MSIALARELPPSGAPGHNQPEPVGPGDSTIAYLQQARNQGMQATGRRVLVADDHDGMRDTVAEIMRSQGYLVTEAQDGQEALDVLRANPVDVLILDLAMPRVDGIEVLRHIDPPHRLSSSTQPLSTTRRRRPRSVPRLFATFGSRWPRFVWSGPWPKPYRRSTASTNSGPLP